MKKTILLFATLAFFLGCDKTEDSNPSKACFDFQFDENNISSGMATYVGDEITFTNCSEAATSYLWDFDNDYTTTVDEPKYIYTEAKGYLVSLKTFGEVTDSVSKLINVNEYPSKFVVDFNANKVYRISRCMSNYYEKTNVGSFYHELTFMSENIATVEDNGAIVLMLGSGELLTLGMLSESSNGVPDGTYAFAENGSAGTFIGGIVYINADFETGTANELYEINNGEITIKNIDNLIMAEINCTSTQGNTITGSFRVSVNKYDASNVSQKATTKNKWRVEDLMVK